MRYCCKEMKKTIEHRCHIHENIYDCPDNLICYGRIFDEYGLIIHDGSASGIIISFCPFCGSKLPKSKRDLWFDTVEKLGYEPDLDNPEVPQEFHTDEWWKKRKLHKLEKKVQKRRAIII